MSNKGYVTVFLSIMLVVMLVISTAVIHIVDLSGAKTKQVTAVSSVTSSELANYNRFIFDRYHILLLDGNAGNRGEGALEAEMVELLKEDLGDEYQVNDIELSGKVHLMDDDLAEFKKQINDNFLYDAADSGIDLIKEKTSGKDTPVDDETINRMDSDIAGEQEAIEKEEEKKKQEENEDGEQSENEDADQEGNQHDAEEREEVKDPRDSLKAYTDAGLAVTILPDDVSLSENIVDYSELPSSGRAVSDFEDVDTSFTDIDRMKIDTGKGGGWGDELTTGAEALVYARKHFNSLTDRKYDDTYLNLEMEYLIAGKETDGANYKSVVNRILLIRFGVNFASIVLDVKKMSECSMVAWGLTWFLPFLQPVVKYLLAGCWAYIESIADVYLLLRGHKVPYMKNESNWVTDFESLSHMDDYLDEPSDEETGLDYNDYLTILMAITGDDLYYRMLDVMQMNATQEGTEGSETSFRMTNAITAFGVNASINYKGKEFNIYEEAGY